MIFKSYSNFQKNPDVLIIGSGPAALSLAHSLEQKKINSAIFESGNFQYNQNLQNSYRGKTSGRFDFDLTTNRSKQFGGTANLWSGRCRPLDECDLKNWSQKKINLKDFQEEASRILMLDNNFIDQRIDENFRKINFEYADLDFTSFYENKIYKSKYIDLVLNSNFITFTSDSDVFKKAKFIDFNTKNEFEVKSKIFVLGCGGIDNSRYLLLLKEKYNLLNKRLPIGKYWMGHFKVHTGEILADYKKYKLFWNNSVPNIALNEKIVENNNFANSSAHMYDNQISKTKFNKIAKDLLCVAPEYTRKITKLFKKNLLCGIGIKLFWGQEPLKENCIKLDGYSNDQFGLPRVNIICNTYDKDINAAELILNRLGKFFIYNDIGRVSVYSWLKYDTISWEGNHHMGGTIIGDNPKRSVVNSNLKVHNTKNLFVIGSSVFARSGYTNPTMSIVQFSLRLAKYIKNLSNKV